MIRRIETMYKTNRLKIDDRSAKQACRHIMSVNKSDRVLLGMTQGIGNVILVTPLIKALVSMNLKIDIITDSIIRNAEVVLGGLEGVTLLTEEEVAEGSTIYLLGLQTFWPYPGLEKYVAQVRYTGNLHEVWRDQIPAHEVDLNMSLAYSLKYQGKIPSLYCNYNPQPDFRKHDETGLKLVGINLCRKYGHQFLANRQLKNPVGIAEALNIAGYTPVLLGPDDCLGIEGVRDYPNNTINATSKGLLDTAGIIRELDCVISEDGGIGHMTAAIGTPLVSIFGPTAHVKNRPWSEKCILITSGRDCSPCQYTERQNQCFKNNCMDIDPHFVVKQVTDLIG